MAAVASAEVEGSLLKRLLRDLGSLAANGWGGLAAADQDALHVARSLASGARPSECLPTQPTLPSFLAEGERAHAKGISWKTAPQLCQVMCQVMKGSWGVDNVSLLIRDGACHVGNVRPCTLTDGGGDNWAERRFWLDHVRPRRGPVDHSDGRGPKHSLGRASDDWHGSAPSMGHVA